MSLFTRIFTTNAAVLAAAVLVLAIAPLTVSAPLALQEAVVLVAGLTAVIVVNLFLLRRHFAPLQRLTELMGRVELLRPGQRIGTGQASDQEVVRLTTAFNEMLERLERERRESVRRSLAAQEAERQRVAQELHDEVGQSLTAVLLELDQVARSAPEELREELGDATETARHSLEDIRRIAQRLRPEALDDLGLPNALAALGERLSEQGGVRVRRSLEEDLPELGREGELVIYRVAQEGITNALRHAEASTVTLRLRRATAGVRLEVLDDGHGVGDAPPGAGISGMRERALLVGGDLAVHTRREGGTCVRLDLPVPS